MENRNAYILRETALMPGTTKQYEGAFAQGSGYLHIRGSYEEGLIAAAQDEEYMRLPANVTVEKPRHPRSKCGTYVPGVTGNHPLLREELVNLPNPLVFRVFAGKERLDMDASDIREYSRYLDMKNGSLTREFRWNPVEGGAVACRYHRFVSMKRPGLLVQEMTYTALVGDAELHFISDIDEKVRTNGYNHFSHVEKAVRNGRIEAKVVTDNRDEIYLSSLTFSDGAAFREAPEQPVLEGNVHLPCGESVSIYKLTAVCTSRDPGEKAGFERLEKELAQARENREHLQAEHDTVWQEMWEQAAVTIEGDEKSQLAVNFSLYHLMRSASRTDDRIAVCAKGFAGEAYFGHFFWDTEIYLLPFFLYNFPDTAKNLTGFRLRTLEGAKKNAAAYGCSGARYPWESSVSGLEQCPNWQYADHEVHVTADVVFGLWHYYQATGDEEFLLKAAPVFLETARYWADRIEFREDGTLHLNGVMGPDEYTCFCNDNAYTNTMVRFAMEKTLAVLKLIKEKEPASWQTMKVEPEFLQKVETIAQELPVLRREDGVILQCREFEALEEPRFQEFWKDRSRPFGGTVSQDRCYRVKALKQADVLMLPYLFPQHFSPETIRKNMEYYLPYTTHDSSLSAIIHSILFARLGEKQQAWEFFERALDIDLDETAGGAAEGIHIANCGGIWQALLFGFAGMLPAYESDTPVFAPRLPETWRSLSFGLVYGGKRYRVRIEGDQAKVSQV